MAQHRVPTTTEEPRIDLASPRGDGPSDPPTDVVTITFTYRDVAYTVDLDPEQAAEFDRSVAPFVTAARRVGGSTRPTPPSPTGAERSA